MCPKAQGLLKIEAWGTFLPFGTLIFIGNCVPIVLILQYIYQERFVLHLKA